MRFLKCIKYDFKKRVFIELMTFVQLVMLTLHLLSLKSNLLET